MICENCLRILSPLLHQSTRSASLFPRRHSLRIVWRLLSTFPSAAAKAPGSSSATFFVESERWSERIADAVLSHAAAVQPKEGGGGISDIWLSHPGDSPLTRVLLQRTNSAVVAWERRTSHTKHLQSLVDEFGLKRFRLKERAFVGDSTFKMGQESMAAKTGSGVVVIGSVPEMDLYVSRLLFATSGDTESIWRPGRVINCLYASGLEYRLMTEGRTVWTTHNYRRSLFYASFFTTKLLLTIPITAFKRVSSSSAKVVKGMAYDRDHMYLTSLTVRPDLFESVCAPGDLPKLVRLLKLAARKKCHRVIPTLEKWCLDVGLSLIELEVSMLDQFKHVPIEAWPAIYQALVSSQHYDYSALRLLLEADTGLRRLERAAATHESTADSGASDQLYI